MFWEVVLSIAIPVILFLAWYKDTGDEIKAQANDQKPSDQHLT